jgi:hypothetical protein
MELRSLLKNIQNQVWENEKELVNQKVYIEQILKNQQEEIAKAHDYVIIVDGVNNIKVYEKGQDITKGIKEITITTDRVPKIEYEKEMI